MNTIASLLQGNPYPGRGILVGTIRERAVMIHKEASQIAQGADDLARRGESQAASLEQTAAAVEQISGNTSMTSTAAPSTR